MRQLSREYEGSDLPHDKVAFIISFLQKMHLHAQEKIGNGIARIIVRPNNYGNSGLYLIREDGNEIDIGWTKCINFFDYREGKPDEVRWHEYDVKHAFRHEIVEQTAAAKGGRGDPDRIAHHEDKQFDKIFNDFLREYHLAPKDIDLTGYEDMSENKSLKDRDLAKKWRVYHKTHSTLTVESRDSHNVKHKHRKQGSSNNNHSRDMQSTLFDP